MKLDISLNSRSLNHAIGELKRYQESLEPKAQQFVRRLVEEGIKVADSYRGFYGGYIVFEKEFYQDGNHQVGILIGRNSKEITSVWNKKGKIARADISPILFAEFGAGWLAEVLFDDISTSEVGQGTFPGQTHAFDPNGWWYMGLNGQWYHSKGFKPSHPMYHAEMEMLGKIFEIGREVFGDGI